MCFKFISLQPKETGSCFYIRCTLWVFLIWQIPAGSKLNKLRNSAKASLYITQQATLPFSMLLFMELSKIERKCKDSWNV